MASRPTNTPNTPPDISQVTSQHRRECAELLRSMHALDASGEGPLVESNRAALRERARTMGLRIKSFTISTESLPDPVIDALPEAELRAITAVHKAMYTQPAHQIKKVRALITRHPGIPVLRNQLAMALNHAGETEEAERVLATCIREFPTYIFGFCNYVMLLVQDGRIDEARTLMENGHRGPVYNLCDFDPSREVFHITEALSYASVVGHYLLATGRTDAAKAQLGMLLELDADSAQTMSLAAALPPSALHEVLNDLAKQVLEAEMARRTDVKHARPTKSRPKPKNRPTRT